MSSASPKKKQKTETVDKSKRRRSSFIRGRNRRSLPPANIDVAELHKKIPADEAEEKRFALLHQVCFEYTLNRLEEEMPTVKGFEEFKSKARSAFNETLDNLDKEGCLRDACSTQTNLPNPINVKIEEFATKINEQLDRIVDESNKWDQLLASAKEDVAQSERLLSTKMAANLPDTLSEENRRYIAKLPNLNEKLTSTKTSLNKLEMHVDTIMTTHRQLKGMEECVDNYLNQQIKLLAKNSETDADISPETLIGGSRPGN